MRDHIFTSAWIEQIVHYKRKLNNGSTPEKIKISMFNSKKSQLHLSRAHK